MTTLETILILCVLIIFYILANILMFAIAVKQINKNNNDGKVVYKKNVAIYYLHREDFKDEEYFDKLCQDFGYETKVDKIRVPVDINSRDNNQEAMEFSKSTKITKNKNNFRKTKTALN